MLNFSSLKIEAAVANCSEAMEEDTISKNGRSSKSHTSRGHLFKIVTTCVLSYVIMSVSAQSFFGDITPIKNQKEVNLVLDFSGVWVNSNPEEIWLAEEIKNKTEEEKTKWLSEWNDILRSKAYSELITSFNKEMIKSGMMVDKYPNAQFTILVQVKEIYTGWYGGRYLEPARVLAEISFIHTGESIPFASVTGHFSRTPFFGSHAVYAWFVTRISSAFSGIGKDIGKSIINFTPSSQTIISICNMEVMSYDFVASWKRAQHICPDGWRLPTSEELKCMCNQKKTKKKDSPLELLGSQYWTSDEAKDREKAITRTINDCKEISEDKNFFFYVRYVRK